MKTFKKYFATVACMSILLTGCGSSANSEKKMFSKAGTYETTVSGHNGDIIVKAVFTSEKIESIEVESNETETIGVPAMDQLRERIMETQSLNIDSVSGATISSEAFIGAMNDLVLQAGGDPESLKGNITTSVSEYSVTEADLIVVGAGGAGLTAALTGAENGVSVILLEKSGVVGGNTLCAFNGMNAAGSEVQKALGSDPSLEEFKEIQMNNDEAREELVDALVENSGEVIDWLANLGVEFSLPETHGDPRPGDDLMVKALADGSTTQTLVNAVYKKIKDNENITIYMNMDAQELVLDDSDAVTGVKAVSADGESVTFSGKKVILATGGFGQNRELVAEVNPDLANTTTDEIAPTTGEGLEMAEKIGAKSVDLGAIQTFPHVVTGYGMITPMNLPGGMTPAAIYVNENAERFTAETFAAEKAILAQPNGTAFCIFPESSMNDTMTTLLNTGFAVEANSVEELANKLGLDVDTLTKTVDAWNSAVESGTDSEFGREENFVGLDGKLFGYKFGVGAHYCMGGLLINENAQVLNTEEKVIENLYAAGEVTGGVQGTYRVDGTGIGDAFIFGRIAGREASAAIEE